MAGRGGIQTRLRGLRDTFPVDILQTYQEHQAKQTRTGTYVVIGMTAVGLWGGFLAALLSLGAEAPFLWSSLVIVASFTALLRPDVALIMFLFVSSSAPEADNATLRPQDVAIPILLLFSQIRAYYYGTDEDARRLGFYIVALSLAFMLLSLVSRGTAGLFPIGVRWFASACLVLVPLSLQLSYRSLDRVARYGAVLLLAGHLYWLNVGEEVGPGVLHGPTGELRPVWGATTCFVAVFGFVLWAKSRSRFREIVAWTFVMIAAYVIVRTQGRAAFVSLGVGVGAALLLLQRVQALRILLVFALIAAPIALVFSGSLQELSPRSTQVLNFDSSSRARLYAYLTVFHRTQIDPSLLGKGISVYPLGWYDSEYLRVLYESGLIGISLFILLLLRLFIHSLRRLEKRERTAAQCALFALLAAGCVNMLFLTTLSAVRSGEMLLGMIGLLLALHAARQREDGQAQVSSLRESETISGTPFSPGERKVVRS